MTTTVGNAVVALVVLAAIAPPPLAGQDEFIRQRDGGPVTRHREQYMSQTVDPMRRDADGRRIVLIGYLPAWNAFSYALLPPSLSTSSPSSGADDRVSDLLQHPLLPDHVCISPNFKGQVVSGALRYAIEEVNSNPQMLSGYKLDFIFANECGEELRATNQALDMIRQGCHAFVGPEVQCRTVARMAGAAKIPIVSYVSLLFHCDRAFLPEMPRTGRI